MVVDADESVAANRYLPYCFDTEREWRRETGGGAGAKDKERKSAGNGSPRYFSYFPASNRSP